MESPGFGNIALSLKPQVTQTAGCSPARINDRL